MLRYLALAIATILASGWAVFGVSLAHRDPVSILGQTSHEADYAVSAAIESSVESAWTLPHDELASLFARDRLGGYCGLLAEFTAQRLRRYGYDAFTIDFGIPDTDLSHVTTILHRDGQFLMLDPTFNLTLEHNDEMVDVFEAMNGSPYRVVQKGTSERDWLVHDSDIDRARSLGVALDQCRSIEPIAEQPTSKCRIERYDVAAYISTVSDKIVTAGLPSDDTILIALMPRGLFGVGVVTYAETRDAFVAKWRAQGLPVHNPGL